MRQGFWGFRRLRRADPRRGIVARGSLADRPYGRVCETANGKRRRHNVEHRQDRSDQCELGPRHAELMAHLEHVKQRQDREPEDRQRHERVRRTKDGERQEELDHDSATDEDR